MSPHYKFMLRKISQTDKILSYKSFFSLRSSQGSHATFSYYAVTILFRIHNKFYSLVSLTQSLALLFVIHEINSFEESRPVMW